MSKAHSYLFPIFLTLLLSGCRETSASLQEYNSCPVYEDSVYCFNGRSIVTVNGLKGIVDTDGNSVLPPDWDNVEFLDDNIAILTKSGIWSLCTRDGRIFAQSPDSLSLESSYLDLYEEMTENDLQYWNQVLETLEVFEEACLTAKSGQLDEKIIRSHAILQKQLEECPGGRMTASQLERLNKIEEDFKLMFRK